MGDKHNETLALDPLDYLVPPAKKSYGTLETDLQFSREFQRRTDIRLIEDFRKRITRQIKSSFVAHESLQTSSSVILKKTDEVIIEPYVFGYPKNCTTSKFLPPCKKRRKLLSENKPMIKVTVVPREAETQTSKIFNKRRERTVKLQSTVSNQENSTKSQNVYFMVKGKRREKVCEIKSSESTNLSKKLFSEKYEDISIQQITNSKRLLSSLNMEKKKHKNKKTAQNTHNIFNTDDTWQNINNFKDSQDVNARKSKVTIVGQLGLTRDEQYVLKCAATVNDQPIAADYVQFANLSTTKRNLKLNPEASTSNEKPGFSLDDRNNYRFRYQHSNVQTDVCYENTCINLNSRSDRMNSQATQVNFNSSRPNPPKAIKNKEAQCNCDISTSENNIFNNKAKDVLQDYKSPLVVISVYPRQECEDINYSPVKIIQQPIPTQKKVNIPFKATKGRLKTDNVQSVTKPGQMSSRSRSPSPVSKIRPYESLVDKKFDRVSGKNIQLNTNQPLRNVNKSKHKLNSLKKDASCYCPYSKGLENEEFPKFGVKYRGQNLQETDPKQVKQALVNNFLKSVDGIDQNDAKMKFLSPKTDTSRVAINIDGENERYNVLFEQRDLDTGLSVRKTTKKQSQAHNTQDLVDANSTENFLMSSNEINRDTPMYSRKPRDVSKVVPKQPRLNVRDSLEISHSRGGRGSLHQNQAQIGKYKLPDSPENSKFKAPGKHYRGDNCSIPDPNERDKEIRQLLGIVRHTINSRKDEQVFNKDHHKDFYSHPENQKDNCCCCKKRNSRDLMSRYSNKSLKRIHGKISKARLKKCGARNIGVGVTVTEALNKNKKLCNNLPESFHIQSEPRLKNESYNERHRIHRQGNVCINKNLVTNVPHTENTAEQNNFMFNRNIQMFLQIEQLTNQKPLNLTRKQYEKVKRTIRGTIKHRCCNFNNVNNVSVGEIKIKPRVQQIRYDRDVQTEQILQSEFQKTVRCIAIQTQHYKNHRTKTQDEKHNHPRESKENKISCEPDNKQNEQSKTKLHKTISTADTVNENKPSERKTDKAISTSDRNKDKRINKNVIGKNPMTNQILSSMAIHYTNVAYTKRITISSTHFGDRFHNKYNNHYILKPKPSKSLHTIFKGHRKSATPNLGTSTYSLCSNENESTKSIMGPEIPQNTGDSKPKKPFLQRLLSCLAMRTTETTILKEAPERNLPSVNSSVDSYHISTSLGAIEMSSSLYDTSASFYSNHTISPTKMKRGGFFSSVRGFLMTRRS